MSLKGSLSLPVTQVRVPRFGFHSSHKLVVPTGPVFDRGRKCRARSLERRIDARITVGRGDLCRTRHGRKLTQADVSLAHRAGSRAECSIVSLLSLSPSFLPSQKKGAKANVGMREKKEV